MFIVTLRTLYKAFEGETALIYSNSIVNRKSGKNKAVLP